MADYIALLRCKPSPDAVSGLVADLRESFGSHDSSMVFIHGDAVESISGIAEAGPDPDVEWLVCRTSLVRRSVTDAVPPPFRIATLTEFYESMLSAVRIDSLGSGGRLCFRSAAAAGQRESGPRVLLEIGFAPLARHQHRETLEMALGAAALELDAAVLFAGEGLAHLQGAAARGWSQITDFDLLKLHVESPGRLAPEIAARAVDPIEAARLRAGAATILLL